MCLQNCDTRKRAALIAVFAAILPGQILLLTRSHHSAARIASTPAESPFTAQNLPVVIHWNDPAGIITPDDRDRLVAISTKVFKRHTLTDDDLTFALRLLNSEPLENKSTNKLSLQAMTLSSLIGSKDLTKDQVERIIDGLTPFTKSPNSTVAFYATLALGGTHDARVIPILEDISRTTYSDKIRDAAHEDLRRLRNLKNSGAI